MVMHDINNRILYYLSENKAFNGKGFRFSKLCELYIDYMGLHKPLNVTYEKFVMQLYKHGKIPEVPVNVKITVPKPAKVKTRKERSPRKPRDKNRSNSISNRKEEYAKQLQTDEWKAKRHEILERDGKRCQLCDDNRGLQVHHKKYIDGLKAWEYENRLLITLCHKCHKKFHNK